MENIENVQRFIRSLDLSTSKLGEELKPILSKPLEEQIALIEDPLEKIKFFNNYLYCVVSLLFAYLKSSGEDTNKHPIMKELARVKTYMNRLKELETKISKADTTKKDAVSAKNFLQQTLGSKVNGGGAAVPDSLSKPAISSANFEGKHTKFNQDEENETQKKIVSKKPSISKKPSKILKPVITKKNKKSK